jgi:hypothetical protein
LEDHLIIAKTYVSRPSVKMKYTIITTAFFAAAAMTAALPSPGTADTLLPPPTYLIVLADSYKDAAPAKRSFEGAEVIKRNELDKALNDVRDSTNFYKYCTLIRSKAPAGADAVLSLSYLVGSSLETA